MIIFNEKEYVENVILKDKFEINNSIVKSLSMLAKYYVYERIDKSHIPKLLEDFLIAHGMEYCNNDIYIKKAMKIAEKYKLIHNKKIYITENDLKFIKGFNNNTIERIAFVMLVMSKFSKHYVKLIPYDIQRYTKQNLNYDDFYKYYKIIRQSKNAIIYKNAYKIKHDSQSPIALIIDDYNSMIIEYLKTCKTKEYIYCECCGVKVKRINNKIKYCRRCAYEINIEKTIKNRKKFEIEKS